MGDSSNEVYDRELGADVASKLAMAKEEICRALPSDQHRFVTSLYEK